MNEVAGAYLYQDQRAAEDAASRYRGDLIGVIAQLEELNESVDSHKLALLIESTKFRLGL